MYELSKETINIIKNSAHLVTVHANEITTEMYTLLFSKHPNIKHFFENAPKNQYMILAEALSSFAMNIDNLQLFKPVLKSIARTHTRVKIKPVHYPLLGMILMDAMEKTLGDKATVEFLDAWREAYKFLSITLIDMEKEIYAEQDTANHVS